MFPRIKFIQNCFNTGKVSIQIEDGQLYQNVPIDKVSLREVIFPSSRRKLGSPVVWMNIPIKDQPVVIAVYDALDEFQKLEEDQFSLEKITGSGSVKISGKGKSGELFISVNNFSKTSTIHDLQDDELEAIKSRKQIEGGKIYVDVQNDSGTAELNVNVKGKVNIVTEDTTYIKNANELLLEVRDEEEDKNVTTKISIKNGILSFKIVNLDDNGNEQNDKITKFEYSKKIGLNYIDEFENQIITDKDQVQIISKKISLNKGDEPMLLGKAWKNLMDDFITELSKITTSTMIGVQPIINAAQVLSFKEKTEAILSKLGFLEKEDSR